jgi:hypothetical protein
MRLAQRLYTIARVDTYFARSGRTMPLSSLQLELVVGSLLGDGTLLPTTRGYCFRVHHGLVQQPLVTGNMRSCALSCAARRGDAVPDIIFGPLATTRSPIFEACFTTANVRSCRLIFWKRI